MNVLNTPTKRLRLSDKKKKDTTSTVHAKPSLNIKGWKHMYYTNANHPRETGVAMLLSNKADFRRRKTLRDKQ